jgi:hypothetical protein
MRLRTIVTALTALAVLVLLAGAAATNAARRHRIPARKGCPAILRPVAADSQAEVYFARVDGYLLMVRGCAYKTGRAFTLFPCAVEQGLEASRATCMRIMRLAGSDVAYEQGQWFVAVRDLRTGATLHKVPTRSPLEPASNHVGVGKIVALVLKSDSSAAWIADDRERSTGIAGLRETPYFDVEAVDASGMRLLAAGTDIEPSSLALAAGAIDIGYKSIQNAEGNAVYWTQAGKVFRRR